MQQFKAAENEIAVSSTHRHGGGPVARKLGIPRKNLHDWIKAWKAHGPEGLNRKPGPKPGPRKLKPLQVEETKRSALAPGERTHRRA
jgi:transposase